MVAFRKLNCALALVVTAIAADAGDALLPRAAAADLQLIIRPARRMAPMRMDAAPAGAKCSDCVAECRRRRVGPVCELVCRASCDNR